MCCRGNPIAPVPCLESALRPYFHGRWVSILPFDKGNGRDRNIGKHKNREGEGIKDLPARRHGDLFPFYRHGDSAVDQKAHIKHSKRPSKKEDIFLHDHPGNIAGFCKIGAQHDHVDDQCCQGKNIPGATVIKMS